MMVLKQFVHNVGQKGTKWTSLPVGSRCVALYSEGLNRGTTRNMKESD